MCESSNGSMQEGCISYDIVGCPSLKNTESDDSSLYWIDITADNRLNLGHKIARSNQSVVGCIKLFSKESCGVNYEKSHSQAGFA